LKEIWKDISDYHGIYQVSSCGQIRSLDHFDKYGRLKKGRILKQTKDKGDYLVVNLYRNGKLTKGKVHRLVALTFIPNPNNLPEVNHKDGNKSNNYLSNLEWCTSKENSDHKINVLGKHNRGKRPGKVEYTEKEVREIKVLLKEGFLSQRDIAKLYGISKSTINNINTGKMWSFIQ
jgi:hypothetical protein